MRPTVQFEISEHELSAHAAAREEAIDLYKEHACRKFCKFINDHIGFKETRHTHLGAPIIRYRCDLVIIPQDIYFEFKKELRKLLERQLPHTTLEEIGRMLNNIETHGEQNESTNNHSPVP